MRLKIDWASIMRVGRCLALFAGGVGVAGWAMPAQAQDHITLGAGVSVVPTYNGSKDMRALPVPFIDIKQGPFFANVANGAGIYVVDTPNFKIGGSVTYVMGYRRQDVPAGINKLDDTAGGRLFATATLDGFDFTLGATQSIGGTKGAIVDEQLSYAIQPTDRLTIVPGAVLTWSDARQNQEYFGVSPEEASASGLPAFRPSAGLSSVALGITTNYQLNSHISLVATVTGTTLLGEAQNSPIVKRKTTPSIFLGLSYTL